MAMFTDAWGHFYHTEDEAIEAVIDNSMTEDDLINELSYRFTETELLSWIYSSVATQEAFERDHFDDVLDVKRQWAEDNIFCEGEED